MMHRRCVSTIVVLTLWGRILGAETIVFDSPEKWQNWNIPAGIVEIGERGQLQLKKYSKPINAAVNAHLFTQPTQQRGQVRGGIWQVGSSARTAGRIMDGDVETFWSPNLADDLVDWVVTIDLGRPVLAERIRLHFPDVEGARPLQQFSVFTATGARIQSTDDVFRYSQTYATTKPNRETLIDIELVGKQDTTRVVDKGLDVDLAELNDFRVVRFVRIRADEKTADAALAEVEVIAAGDNVSLGVLGRGGTFDNGLLAREPQNMFDGIMDTYGNIFTVQSKGGWRESGVWWEADLGALFWLDEAFIYWQDRGEGLSSFLFEGLQAGQGYEMLYSDGRRTITGDIDYTPLIFEPAPSNGVEGALRHHRYRFAPRKIRYLFWHSLTDQGWFSHPMELMLFSPGYPAQVTLQSEFIDLGRLVGDDRPKAIKALNWQADLPAKTRLQLRSRSGNQLQDVYAFYDRKGEEITETKWTSLPAVLKGAVDTTIIAGSDWGEWSNFYQFSGEPFQSETPRRFVQLELIISTDDFQVAPIVQSLSIDFEDALVQLAQGRVLPREAPVNAETRFTFVVYPRSDERDSGFDRLRFFTPSAVDEKALELRINGAKAIPNAVESAGDSLLVIDLPQTVTNDSVEVEFTARVLDNATVFGVELGRLDRPGLWQSVEAVERRANIVYVPELMNSRRFIDNLSVVPQVFTPNGDGVNDRVAIRFVLLKASDAEPEVAIADLAGRQVAVLRAEGTGSEKHFSWDGRNAEGALVAPGAYLLRIVPGTEVGEGTVLRTLSVAY